MNKEIRFRTLAFGLLGVLLITSSSMYVALRMGALPWPTLFVTVLSLIFLRKAKDSSIQEITVCHTMMSSGSMVGGALAFTIPGIWIANPNASFPITSLIALTISGALGGLIYTFLLKDKLIVKDKTPFPIGVAAYETLIAGFNKTTGTISLAISMAISAIFAFFRDGLFIIPSVVTFTKPTVKTPSLSMWLSPMALAIGSLIGTTYSITWFAASMLSNFVAIPIMVSVGFADLATTTRYMSNLGIGLMVGTGVFIVLKGIITAIKNVVTKKQFALTLTKKAVSYSLLGFLGITILLLLATDLKLYQIILMIILMGFTTYISGMLTGQTGINPMEIMGILALLAISSIYIPSSFQAFTICAIVAVACGLVGDVTNDLKSGHLSNTSDKSLLIAEGIGAIIGALVSVFVLLLLKKVYGGFNNDFLVTPQAHAVAAMVQGLEFPTAFAIGIAIAVILSLFRLPVATLGLGVFLPIAMSTIVAFGALINILSIKMAKEKDKTTNRNRLIASGLLGGEGLMGVVIAIIMLIG